MKKALMAAAALVALPVMAQAQSPSPGVYIGAEGGVNWLLNFTANTNIPAFPTVSVNPQTGWAACARVSSTRFLAPQLGQVTTVITRWYTLLRNRRESISRHSPPGDLNP